MNDPVRSITSELNFLKSDINRSKFSEAKARIENIKIALAPLLSERADDKKVITLQEKLAKAETDMEQKIIADRIDEVLKEVKKNLNFAASSIRQGQFEKAKQYLDDATQGLDALEDQTDKRVVDFRSKIEKEHLKLEQTVKTTGIKEITQQLKTKRSQLDRNLRSDDDTMKLELVQELEFLLNNLKVTYPDDCEPLYKQTSEYLEKVGAQIKKDGAERIANEITKNADVILSSLRRAMDAQDVKYCVQIKAELDAEIQKIESSLASDHPIALEFLSRASSFLTILNNAMGPLIAEKEIEIYAPQLQKAVDTLKRHIANNDLSQVPKAKENILIGISRLAPYQGTSTADEVRIQAEEYLATLEKNLSEKLKEAEIDNTIRSLNVALVSLERDIQDKNICNILKTQDRVRAAMQPLLRFKGHTSAQDFILRLEKAFQTIENELSELLAAQVVTDILPKVDIYLKFLAKSVEDGDQNNTLTYCRKCYELSYSLEQAYPHQKATKDLMHDIDASTSKAGMDTLLAPIDNVVQSTIEKADVPYQELVDIIQKYPENIVLIKTHLEKANQVAFSLRVNHIASSKARGFLRSLDSFNRLYTGSIPEANNERFPSFNISPMAHRDIQACLKKINDAARSINKELDYVDQEANVPESVIDGSHPFNYTVNVDSAIQRDIEGHHERAKKSESSIYNLFDRVEQYLEGLKKADPDHGAISLVEIAMNDIRSYLAYTVNDIRKRWRYAIYVRWALHVVDIVEKVETSEREHFDKVERKIRNKSVRNTGGSRGNFISAVEFYPHIYEYLLTADNSLKTSIFDIEHEEHVQHDRVLDRYERLLAQLKIRFVEVHTNFAVYLESGGNTEEASKWLNGLKGPCFDAFQTLQNRLSEVKLKREEATHIAIEKHQQLKDALAQCSEKFESSLKTFLEDNMHLKSFDFVRPLDDSVDPVPHKNIYEGETYDFINQEPELISALIEYSKEVKKYWESFMSSLYKKYGLVAPIKVDHVYEAQPLLKYDPFPTGSVYTKLGDKKHCSSTRSEEVTTNTGLRMTIQKTIPFFYQVNLVQCVKSPSLSGYLDGKPVLQSLPDFGFLNPIA